VSNADIAMSMQVSTLRGLDTKQNNGTMLVLLASGSDSRLVIAMIGGGPVCVPHISSATSRLFVACAMGTPQCYASLNQPNFKTRGCCVIGMQLNNAICSESTEHPR